MDKIVVANLKTYLSTENIDEYLKGIDNKINSENVIICPTSIYLPYFLKHKFQVGAQNIFYENDTCTGEVTPHQYKTMGVTCALIGHSDRRRKLKETEEIINKKLITTLQNGMGAILCIGETLEEKSMLKTNIVLKKQIFNALVGVKDASNLVVAYEPVWAIGTNKTPSMKDIKDAAVYIKSIVKKFTGIQDVMVLYGGSVNDENIKEINQIEEINGVLVGSSSTKPDKLLRIIEVVVGQ